MGELKFKGTPGPWASEEAFIFPVGAPEPIARAFGSVDDLYIPWRANAQLIAAAPDLLEAAQGALARLGEFVDEDGMGRHCLECLEIADVNESEPFIHKEGCSFGFLRAAIAKALGS